MRPSNTSSRYFLVPAIALNLVVASVVAAPLDGAERWRPRAAARDAAWETVPVRIVDFGADFLRDGDGRPLHQFGCHRYTLRKDQRTGLSAPLGRGEEVRLDLSVDVDGDGRHDDDVVAYREFSLQRPFSPEAPWYDTWAGSPRWYGGTAIYQANARSSGFSEDGVNQEHDGQRHRPRDNWALFHETYEIYSPYRLAAVWLWQKHDFLNGARDAEHRVTFDDNSRLALLLQRYFMCIDSVRFLVRDGGQCYVSEATFQRVGAHQLSPNSTHWARHQLNAPHDIYFDAAKTPFQKHEFQNVTAVGIYVSKDRFIPSYFGYKWYAFECDAVVHRKQRPSEHINMVHVSASPTLPPFFVSTTEVPYELWKHVFRLVRSNCFVPPSRGFNFDKDGDMGSMDFAGPEGQLLPHGPREPVTDVTLADVAAWCNALSIQESRTPCYFEDARFEKPLREVLQSPLYLDERPSPKLYVNWAADGYRLPTSSEWLSNLQQQDVGLTDASAWQSINSGGTTHHVGAKQPDARGMYDLLGNVWELVWTFGDCYDPRTSPSITVLGGDFLWPSDPLRRSANRGGDAPYEGAYNIGFRVVRRETGLPAPTRRGEQRVAPKIPLWTIRRGQMADAHLAEKPQPTPVPETVPIAELNIEMAQYETSYRRWKQVHDWALAHGYEFDCDGDMGSMDYWGFRGWGQGASHTADEPVTDIHYYDMVVWCNALSEVTGRDPVYHVDEALKQVYKKSLAYRPVHMTLAESERATDSGLLASGIEPVNRWVHLDPKADGYRLPTRDEFLYALTSGKTQQYGWGNEPEGAFDHAWLFDTSGGTTHPVGRQKPNVMSLYDMHGNVSEVSEQIAAGPMNYVERLGGSFVELTLGVTRGGVSKTPKAWPYYDSGFRVVRQRPRSQRRASAATGKVRFKASDAPQHKTSLLRASTLDVDPSLFDPLVGRVHRGSLYRDGVFQASGVASRPTIRWRFCTGGPIKSSPVVADGVVFFGSWDKHIYAVDARTGRLVWKVQTGDKVSGSAAVADKAVYFAGEDGCVRAMLAASGKLQWKTECGRQMAGSPAVAYGVVFVGSGAAGGAERGTMSAGPIVGLDATGGVPVWQGAGSGPQGLAAICLDDASLYAGIPAGARYGAWDLATGRSNWSTSGGHQNRPFMSMSRHGEIVYAPGSITGTVIAWNCESGRELWHAPILPGQLPINNDGEPGHELFSDLAIAHGRVYVGCNDGKLHTFDASNGRRGWTFQTGGKVQSSPSVAGDIVYFGSWDGYLYAVQAQTGSLLWKFKLSDQSAGSPTQGAAEGGRIVSAPWPADGVIYVGCDDGNLYAIGSDDK